MEVPRIGSHLVRMTRTKTDWGANEPGRLRAYNLALRLSEQVREVLRRARCPRSLSDQAERCVHSCVLNIAEGAAHRTAGQRARYFQIARASAGELIGCLDLLLRHDPRAFVSPARRNARLLSGMLASLIDYWSDQKH